MTNHYANRVPRRIPALVKEDFLNQLDQSLSDLGINARLGLLLSANIIDNHIATTIVMKTLEQYNDVDYQWMDFSALFKSGLPKEAQIILLSKNGDTFLLSRGEGDNFILRTFFHLDQEVFRHQDTLSNLMKDFNIVAQALVIKSACTSPKKENKSPQNYTYHHFFRHKKTILSIIGSAVFMALLGVATPLGFQTFTDKILPYSATGSLYVVATFLLLSAIASSVFKCFHDFQENVLFAKYQNGLGKDVFNRLLGMEVAYFDQHKVGDLTKLVDQVKEASNFLIRQALASVVSVISLVIVLPILFIYSAKLTGIVLIIGVLMAFTIGVALKPIRNRVMQAYGYDAGFQSTLIETLKGMKTIKSLSNESHFRNRANISLETNLYGGFNVARLSNVVSALVNFQSQLITISVIFFGAQAVFSNELTIGQLIAFNMLANNVVNPLVALVMTASGWENFKLANNKLNELHTQTSSERPLYSDKIDLNGDIEFDDVWFCYPKLESESTDLKEEKYVLKGVSFCISQGDIMGIVGSSGSGKSTVAALLMGFYKPTKGKIKINGFDISLLTPELLRSHISSVQQTSFLFNASVIENIHLGRLGSSVEDIQGALKGAGAEDFVDTMPHKMYTKLSEDGDNLSGGQRQRLAIARALVRQADILLFDEATSALDNQTEDRIKETIYKACRNKTALIIAHRLNTLSYCDKLIVMTQGRVEIIGTHEDLIQTENSYSKMWSSLSSRTDEKRALNNTLPKQGCLSKALKEENQAHAIQF
ncbi:peptidase domain-containing ABC transporter [Marinomonas algicola]|uniref:peptidase domain-containing ABC transporter n=1 Tax=Marinomonas algicola TaxID=2773454 RepID=UPI001749D242|nr:peptidase domain-containing ABC transporter [Marinomonas algicola]